MYKKVITIIMIISLIGCFILNPVEVYAINVPGAETGPFPLISLIETLREGAEDGASPIDFLNRALENSGFLAPINPALENLNSLDQYITGNVPDLAGETAEETASNVTDFVLNNVSVNQEDNSITFNDNSKTFIKGIANDTISRTGMRVAYTFNFRNYPQYFSNRLMYDSLGPIANQTIDNDYCVMWNGGSNICEFGKDDYSLLVTNNSNANYYICSLYSNSSWTNRPDTGDFVKMDWNGTNNNYVEASSLYTSGLAGIYVQKDPLYAIPNLSIPCIPTVGSIEIPVFLDLASLQQYSVGIKPYYYNTSVWQDFSLSQGDYTYTPTNINTVTYGDTVSYVQDYHDTNNNYPTYNDTSNWIENTNTENITNNNGGGSGGSGDDNGGSGGSGDSNIFDWLKTLGSVLGNLIKGVGEFLSEIVAGLVDAVTNLLEAISNLISGVLESLTNIFSGLIEFIYAGLPDEIKNILSLALVVAILITVLKLIRGN